MQMDGKEAGSTYGSGRRGGVSRAVDVPRAAAAGVAIWLGHGGRAMLCILRV